MRILKAAALFSAAAMLACAAGCDAREEYTISIRNLTEAEISEINIYPDNGDVNYENVLEENLAYGAQTEVTIGDFTEEEIKNGFDLLVTNAEDGSQGDFSMLFFDSGDTITFYLDDWGLAVGVNLTDEEVQEQIAQEHELFMEAIEEMEAEETDSAESEE